jgi:ADP-heptose:LPS heptosyltransferase
MHAEICCPEACLKFATIEPCSFHCLWQFCTAHQVEKLGANSYPEDVLAMGTRTNDLAGIVRTHYEQYGLFKTVTGILKGTATLCVQTILNPLLLVSDTLFERYYLTKRSTLSDLKGRGGLKIAVVRIGGMGDAVVATALVNAIREKWADAHISVFVYFEDQLELLSRDKQIDQVVLLRKTTGLSKLTLASLMVRRDFDICFVDHHIIRVFCEEGVCPEVMEKQDGFFGRFRLNFLTFPCFSDDALLRTMDEYQLRSACTGLRVMPPGLSISLRDDDFQILKQLPKAFMTVHHGAGGQFIERGKGKQNPWTKNWFVDRWAGVLEYLRSAGYEVIQLGVPYDGYIPGAVDLRGKTTITEAAAILKNALLHLDTEGGLVHLARATGTKSLVLFGPTPVEFYGYDDNINIRAGECRDCWASHPNWLLKCQWGHERPLCMDAINTQMVIDALRTCLTQTESLYKA